MAWSCASSPGTDPRCEPGALRLADDGCNTCTCTDQGTWSCGQDTCVQPDCPPMAPDPDECPGPMVARDPITGGCCRYENSCSSPDSDWVAFNSLQVACETLPTPHCNAGERVPAGDGCNECVCEDGERWTCTVGDCGGASPSKACGYWEGGCPEGQYCAFVPVEACSSSDAPSVCLPIPGSCSDDDATVCGCDGTTYGNRCLAAQGGVGIRDLGTCPEIREPAWCSTSADCHPDEYCAHDGSAVPSLPGRGPVEVPTCGDDGSMARCRPRPTACINQYSPVCGCDGRTHANTCRAAMAGVGVRARGECAD